MPSNDVKLSSLVRHVFGPRLLNEPETFGTEDPNSQNRIESVLFEICVENQNWTENRNFRFSEDGFKAIGFVDSFKNKVTDEVRN